MIRIVIGILIGLIIFSSCKMGKNYEKVEVNVDSTYRFNNDSVILTATAVAQNDSVNGIKWWELFQDPELDSIVKEGLVNNRNAQIAIKRMEEAAVALKIQKADMWPKFDAQAQVGRGNYSGFITDGGNTNWIVNGAMNWEIDFWGKYRRLNESAKADFVGSQYALQTVQLTLITQIINSYYELLGARASYYIAVQTLALRDSSLQIIQERFDQGIIPEIDLCQ